MTTIASLTSIMFLILCECGNEGRLKPLGLPVRYWIGGEGEDGVGFY